MFLVAQVGCSKKQAEESEAAPAETEAVDVSNEEYVAVLALSSYPIRVDTGIFLITPENVKSFKGEI